MPVAGLSEGEIIGIAVGIALGGFFVGLMAALAFVAWRRRGKKRSTDAEVDKEEFHAAEMRHIEPLPVVDTLVVEHIVDVSDSTEPEEKVVVYDVVPALNQSSTWAKFSTMSGVMSAGELSEGDAESAS